MHEFLILPNVLSPQPFMDLYLPPRQAAPVDPRQRAAHRTPGNRRRDYDVSLRFLIHERPHRVKPLEKTLHIYL